MQVRKRFTISLMATALTVAGVLGVGVAQRASMDGGQAQPRSAVAALHNATGELVGTVTFTQVRDLVRVQAEVWGLPPGFHGFHVHAVGSCDASTAAPFTSAGGHLNPGGHDHAEHAGDMPVLYVLADGAGSLSFVTDRYSVTDLFDGDGSALIVHALPDNYGNIPTRYVAAPDAMTLTTGDAGGRLACGLIQ